MDRPTIEMLGIAKDVAKQSLIDPSLLPKAITKLSGPLTEEEASPPQTAENGTASEAASGRQRQARGDRCMKAQRRG